MKIMVMVRSTAASEAGTPPTAKIVSDMNVFNEKLREAGVLQHAEGLRPSEQGVRVAIDGGDRRVVHGPFQPADALIAGYWVWEVTDMDEALDWINQSPVPMDEPCIVELRLCETTEDFAGIEDAENTQKNEGEHAYSRAMRNATSNPYLFYDGCCEAAFDYYEQHLGAVRGELNRFADSPESFPEGMLPDNYDQKIMHAECTVGDTTIYACDGGGKDGPISGMSLAVTVADMDIATRAFNALAHDGNILMPLQPAFWSPLFGQVKDAFGVTWMIMVAGRPE
ncbi:YciI family protein [Alteromonas sp. ASW11-19]|uniref:YciI family protein n=1 Tax=Alteromonas salexigens TaxID=2982530 RepID=A0ABT2VRM0_9ALTE|nr:VOC family protein [Alteromonas salexigens]MCU7554564.1 YciI family protein [Alteromonas salexigens]